MSSKYVDLITARMTGEERRTTKVPTCLSAKAQDKLVEARDALKAASLEAAVTQGKSLAGDAKPTAAVKAAEKAVKEAEADVLAASIYACYRSLTAGEFAAAGASVDPEAPAVELHKAVIAEAFSHATTLDGERIDNVTREKYAGYVAQMNLVELSTHWAKVQGLNAQVVDFPTLLR